MNWGHGITIAIVLFMGFIVYLAYRTTRAEFDLVSPTYYEDELVYEQDKQSLERGLPFLVDLKQEDLGDKVRFQMPKELTGNISKGSIHVKHPALSKFDKQATFTSGEVSVDKTGLLPNVNYLVRIQFTANGLVYRFDSNLILT
jgi:hypothetical protein